VPVAPKFFKDVEVVVLLSDGLGHEHHQIDELPHLVLREVVEREGMGVSQVEKKAGETGHIIGHNLQHLLGLVPLYLRERLLSFRKPDQLMLTDPETLALADGGLEFRSGYQIELKIATRDKVIVKQQRSFLLVLVQQFGDGL
jgi:hypothetical protein